MLEQWTRKETPPWRPELLAFVIRSRLPGVSALALAVLLTVDLGGREPWLVAFLVVISVINVINLRRVGKARELTEFMGFVDTFNPIVMVVFVPGLLYPALMMSLLAVMFARLSFGPRAATLGVFVGAGLASGLMWMNPVPFAAVSIAVYTVTALRMIAGLGVLARREISLSDRLRERADHDQLTGLLSRSAFMAEVERRLDAAKSEDGDTMSLLYVDVDFFKPINDTYGHHAGDLVLMELGRRLTLATDDCVVGRVGGDEFAVIVPEDVGGAAEAAADAIREAMKPPIAVGSTEMLVSVSVGVGRVKAGDSSIVDLIERADQAMYRAKATRTAPVAWPAVIADQPRSPESRRSSQWTTIADRKATSQRGR